jgi:hypothetical protein
VILFSYVFSRKTTKEQLIGTNKSSLELHNALTLPFICYVPHCITTTRTHQRSKENKMTMSTSSMNRPASSVPMRDALPKTNSFTSVTDIILLDQLEANDDNKASIVTTPMEEQLSVMNDDDDIRIEKEKQDCESAEIRDAVLLVTSPESAPTPSTTRKGVRYGFVEQRIYNRIVGDHPDVKVGPPVTFDWEYGVLPLLTVDDYEQRRLEQRTGVPVSSSTLSTSSPYQPTRYSTGLRRMSSITRKNMLRTLFDVTEEEIIAAEREVQLIQKQRERTVSQSTASAIVESNVRRVGRKFRKSLSKVLYAVGTSMPTPYSISAY